MRLATTEEMEGPEVSACREALSEIPYTVVVHATMAKSDKRVLSFMFCVPSFVAESAFDQEKNGPHTLIVRAIRRLDTLQDRVIPSYLSPVIGSYVSAHDGRDTYMYTFTHQPEGDDLVWLSE
ncbi:hypothetical protein [Aporhodopirellula aestuarii]|uniref:Uncharacterized protein n=1 Tax=Aporhodopirellula aestuarii TaxID=2950107 RepID=A0ABT0TYI0_9BACT|nr:hypothetical protein [Aporhodopirellula aestuarii]MCM2369652.1 hypothetical protein [Aporhodopirellula aestuarii]